MLDAQLGALVTIAGTGGVGFAGDGGLGRLALLRHPEGLALKPNMASGQEVYFADFLNQRLRKLVKINSDWYIYTVAGTGAMATDAACDLGCSALESSLWNPRSLAFASNQDLYFLESGSKKILKLTTSLGDPSQNAAATMISFAGQGLPQADFLQGLWAAFRGIAKIALPGHYSVPNSALVISGMYSIGIDKKDRLWAVDSDNNRIFMLPLTNATTTELLGDFGHFLARFENSFASVSMAEAETLSSWLQAEFPERNLTLKVHTHVQNYLYGYSYWMYGAPATQETWCNLRSIHKWGDQDCDDVSAQLATFGGIMAVCFDAADNLYLVDNEDSQIVYLEDSNEFEHNSPRSTGEKTTESGCPCEQFWVEDSNSVDGEVWLPGVAPYVAEDVIHRRTCQENPSLEGIVMQQYAGYPQELLQALSEVMNCTAVDYCASAHGEHYPKWCYINARELAHSSFKTLCAENTWSWCNDAEQISVSARWRLVPEATVLGNEKRFETIYQFGERDFQDMEIFLTEDLWLSSKMPYDYTNSGRERDPGFFLSGTAILKGFVDPGLGPSICSDYCCGLPKLRSFSSPAGSSGYVCLFESFANLSVMVPYYAAADAASPAPSPPSPPGPGMDPSPPAKLMIVFEELESLVYGVRSDVDEVVTAKLESCKSRCLHDESCGGYMVRKGNESDSDLMSPGQPCVFFGQSQPFYVYTITRTGAPFVNGFVNLSMSSDKYQALQAFVGPGIPASRLTGDQDGLYVSHGPIISKDMISGPHLEYGLLLTECQELCLDNTLCTGIAFPGCYLLKKASVKLLSGSTEQYNLMIKEKVQPKVKSAAGYSKADSYNNETYVQESYLNRPLSCAVDAAGDLIFADFNHRLRKTTGWATNCSVSGGFSSTQVQQYETAVKQVNSVCNSSTNPQMQMLYVEAQREVIENQSLQLLQQNFCDFGASPFASEMQQSFTNNVFILCKACEALSPRPTGCPWLELCACRDAMVQVATQDVHILCPQRNALVDTWHRWITAYTSCWLSNGAALQWNTLSNLGTLQAKLVSLR